MTDVLELFGPATRQWFAGAFAAPTAAQEGAWRAVADGRNALVVAPTGSGKTLAAFLWALDRLAARPKPEDPKQRCRVLYVSPLKALAVDIERNLRAPLTGIGQAARRLGLSEPQITVGIRSGDTPADERRRFQRTPPDVLITTPESLFLILTSQARESLRGVETVIVDEVHAVAGTKRGAHLALSLERVDALLATPAQRVGLSATVRPIDEVARFLGGSQPVQVVDPGSSKEWDLQVVVPVEDLGELAGHDTGPDVEPRSPVVHLATCRGADTRSGRAAPVHDRLRQLTTAGRAAHGPAQRDLRRTRHRRSAPATRRAQTGADHGPGRRDERHRRHRCPRPPREREQGAARPHRGRPQDRPAAGSRRHEQSRARYRHGRGRPRRPGRIAAVGGQRAPAGWAGRSPGGRRLPRRALPEVPRRPRPDRGRGRAHAGGADRGVARSAQPARCPRPTGRLAIAMDSWNVDDCSTLVRRSATHSRPFPAAPTTPSSTCSPAATRPTSSPSCGRGSSGTGPPARSPAGPVPSGSQSPAAAPSQTAGLFGVFLAGSERGARVGELDEEMVYESRVGDVFTLGATSWRIEDITHDRVLVSPAPGQPGRLPFWKGDALGRPAELGAAVGAFVRELAASTRRAARERATPPAWTTGRPTTCSATSPSSARPPGTCPTTARSWSSGSATSSATGGWSSTRRSARRSTPRGRWPSGPGCASATASTSRPCTPTTASCCACPTPPTTDEPAAQPPGADLVVLDPDDVERCVTAEVGGSALFASRFRECAARALLLPRRDPRPAHAAVAAAPAVGAAARGRQRVRLVPDRPRDHARVPAGRLRRARAGRLMRDDRRAAGPVRRGRDRRSRRRSLARCCSATSRRSSTRATRRWPSDARRPCRSTRRCSPSCSAGPSCASCSTPTAIAADRGRAAAARRRPPGSRPRGRRRPAAPARAADHRRGGRAVRRRRRCAASTWPSWRPRRRASGSGSPARSAGPRSRTPGGCATRSACRCRSACPRRSLEPVRDPLGDLVARFARTHGPFHAADVAARLGLGVAVVTDTLAAARGRRAGSSTASSDAGGGRHRVVRRRGAATAPAPVGGRAAQGGRAGRPGRTRVGSSRPGSTSAARCAGVDGLLRVVEQLGGCAVPASALERLVLPARVAGYSPAWLDELTTAGEVVWSGHGSLPGTDGWVSLHVADAAPLTLPDPGDEFAPTQLHDAVLDVLAAGGAFFFRQLADARAARPTTACSWPALWDLVWAGRVTNDTLAPLRSLVGGGRSTHRSRPARPPAIPAMPGDGPRCRSAAGRRSRPAGGPCCRPATPTRPGARTPPPRAARPARRRHPRRGGRRALARRFRGRLPGAVGVRGQPAGPGGATSWRASAQRSSRRSGRSTGSVRSPTRRPRRRTGAGAGARRDRPGEPVRRRAALAGPRSSQAATGPAARPVLSSCSSTARWCCTSNAAAAPCCPGPTTRTVPALPPTRSPSPSGTERWAPSGSSEPTVRR